MSSLFLSAITGCLVALLCSGVAGAQAAHLDLHTALVCDGASSNPPDPDSMSCAPLNTGVIDPQNRLIWVLGSVHLSETQWHRLKSPALFISGKAAARVHINGRFIGANGQPGRSAADEVPGRMDARLPVDKTLLIVGENRLALQLSAQHGWFKLVQPMHALAIDESRNPQDALLRYYWVSLLPFGALLAAALYWSVLAWRSEQAAGLWLLAHMAVLAALQLMAEISRALVAYTYPWHDLRLGVIALCSCAFGLALLAHVLLRFSVPRAQWYWLGTLPLALALMLWLPGYDLKAAGGFLLPALVTLVVSVWAWRAGRQSAGILALGLAVFVALYVLAPSLFLDRWFYLVIAAFLMFLFIQQARALADERVSTANLQRRAERLQMALEQRQQADQPGHLKITGAGQIELLPINDIVCCNGAGDYVELIRIDAPPLLHQDTLNRLEEQLPSTFVRVHRSHLVNTAMIQSLQRNPSGTGTLQLRGDVAVPVSRRLMPALREQLLE